MIGTRLGACEITAKIGEGGMGEVYRATDSKLRREVAIKLLPEAFTGDPDRLARFEREAQLLAQLQHANIASIYGLEESGEIRGLIMELIEGPTLDEHMASRPLPLDEVLSIARQIAEALEAAHEKGIVHRDLKPQNIKLTPEGQVKVLDFGLAKALDPAAAPTSVADLARSPTLLDSPTLTALPGTQLGVILGTAAYMSPEQARGAQVDKRADIWAFGVVLYEMLVGRALFAAETVTDVLAGVLKTEIDFSSLPASMPPALGRLLRRCLQRNPRDRFHDIADVRILIDEILEGRDDEGQGVISTGSPRKPGWALAIGMMLVGLLVGFLLSKTLAPPSTDPSPERWFAIPTTDRSLADRQAISPDGARLTYTAGGSLWLRDLAEIQPLRIAGGDGAQEPFWSPDGQEIGFVWDDALWRVSAAGGAAKRICGLPAGNFDGGTWTEAGDIVFANATGGWSGSLFRCPAAGGNSQPYLEPDRVGWRYRRPQALAGGGRLLFTATNRSTAGEVRILEGGAVQTLLQRPEQLSGAVSGPGGMLYFVQKARLDFDIWSIRLREGSEEPEAEPVLLAEGANFPSVAQTGSLLFARTESPPLRLALVGRDGSASAIGEPFLAGPTDVVLQASPDGTRGVVSLPAPQDSEADQVWIVDLETGARQRLPLEDEDALVAWSPDSKEIVITGEVGARILPLTGGSAPTQLEAEHTIFQPRWTSDGEWIVYYAITAETGRDLFRISTRGDSPPEDLLREPDQQVNPDVSPDGRFLAYQSDESGRPEIYVRPFPKGDRKWQISTDGGISPIWNPEGGELVWSSDNAIWAARIEISEADFEAGAPSLLLRGDDIATDLSMGAIYYNRVIDLVGDGQRLLVAQRAAPSRNEIVYVDHPGGSSEP